MNKLSSQTYFKPYIGISQSKIINEIEPLTSELVYDDKYDYSKLLFGIKVSQRITEKFLLGVNISRKSGGSYTGIYYFLVHNYISAVNLQYLDFIIDTQFELTSYLSLSCGIYQSLRIKAEWEIQGGYGPFVENRSDSYTQFDRGLNLAISGKVKSIILTIQYQHGLTKIINQDRLRWISLNLGYEFNVQKKKSLK